MNDSGNDQNTQLRSSVIKRKIVLPEYQVEELIGSGGMARVYRGLHQPLDREVALKILLPEYSEDPGFAERFMREARIAARLVHPHIVQIYDVDKYKNDLYLAMEYVRGGDLSEKISKGISAKALLKATEELCEALDFAHSEGFIHRDIKPENILFRGDGSLVLSDFGIARSISTDSQLTQAGLVLGTPTYMSPEQAEGKTLSASSDLYSVGVLLFKMITGFAPYRSSSSIEILHHHISAPLPKLPRTLPHLQAFFNRALAKDPSARFLTGAAMVESLKLAFEHADDLIGIRKQITEQMEQVDLSENTKTLKHARSQPLGEEKQRFIDKSNVSETFSRPKGNRWKLPSTRISLGIASVFIAIILSVYATGLRSPAGNIVVGERSETQIENVNSDYIGAIITRAYENYVRAREIEQRLDEQTNRNTSYGNTRDLDVNSIVNATAEEARSQRNYFMSLVVQDLVMTDSYRQQSEKRVDNILLKQQEIAYDEQNTKMSNWFLSIRTMFEMEHTDRDVRKTEIAKYLDSLKE